MFTATAAEIVDTDQPNSARSGSMSTPGTARKAAAPTSARKVTAATHHAGCTRRVRAGALVVTRAEHGRRPGGRTSGPTVNTCKDPAMTPGPGPAVTRGPDTSTPAPRPHEVVVVAVDRVVGFELGLPYRLLGLAEDEHGRPLYRVRVATLDGRPVRTADGFAVLPEHDGSVLAEAETVVVPGIMGGPAVREGRIPGELRDALR